MCTDTILVRYLIFHDPSADLCHYNKDNVVCCRFYHLSTSSCDLYIAFLLFLLYLIFYFYQFIIFFISSFLLLNFFINIPSILSTYSISIARWIWSWTIQIHKFSSMLLIQLHILWLFYQVSVKYYYNAHSLSYILPYS